MKKGENLKSGFTIIEVALVIAIAGLIFLMVFVALPGLRASQRDAERRDDVISFLSNVKKYQTNNRGALPMGTAAGGVSWDSSWEINNPAGTSWAGFYYGYLGEEFMDPVGENYKLVVVDCNSNSSSVGSDCTGNELNNIYESYYPNDYKMVVVTQASCYGEKAVSSSNPRKIAVLYRLEGSGVYCNNT